MKFLALLCLFSLSAFGQDVFYREHSTDVLIRLGISGEKVTILRRTDNSPFEVLSETATGDNSGNWYDTTAEPNTQYYYAVVREKKLQTATKLLFSMDFNTPLDWSNTNSSISNGTITVKPGNGSQFFKKNTGIKLDKNKYYELKVEFGTITGDPHIQILLSGLVCASPKNLEGAYALAQSNKVYFCRLPKPTDPKKLQWYYDDSFSFHINSITKSNFNVEIKKVELYVSE